MRYIVILILLPVLLHSQVKYDNIWLFGPKNGTGTVLDFSAPANTLYPIDLPIYLGSESAMISDILGHLKYYTSGCNIINYINEIIPGADTLNPGIMYDDYCVDGVDYVSGNQSMIWVPRSPERYFLLHKHADRFLNGNGSYTRINDAILVTSINKDTIEFINKNVFADTLSLGTMVAVPGNTIGSYWFITPHDSSNLYFIIELMATDSFSTQSIYFKELFQRNHNGTTSKFSPDGSLYIGYEPAYLEQSLKVFSFDREYGKLEYLYSLPHPEETTSLVGGIEFSPSGRFLYVSTWSTIYQYDLEAGDIEASKTVVAEYDGFVDLFPSTFHVMQRGPDCRIYINSPNSNKYLHVMMHPDVKGPDCEVRQHEIKLYYNHQISMPYFPNYRLGTGEPVCDSTLSLPTSIPVVSLPEEGLRIWPNPASGDCRVMLAPEVLRRAVTLEVVDLWDRAVLTRDLSTNYQEVIPIDVSPLNPGVYFVRVIGRNDERCVERLVVE